MIEQQTPTPWLTVEEMAAYAKVSKKLIYNAIESGKLRAARIGGGRAIRGKAAWIDSYLEECARPVDIQS